MKHTSQTNKKRHKRQQKRIIIDKVQHKQQCFNLSIFQLAQCRTLQAEQMRDTKRQKHHNIQNLMSYRSGSISGTLMKLILLSFLITLASSNGIFMSLNSSNQFVGSSNIYSISFNRSLNTLGQTISPSPLETNYIISIIFDPSYNISSSISITPSSYTLNTNTYTVTLTLSTVINLITISNIINPLPSQTPLKITLNFYNASSPTVILDTCSATLTFQSLSLSSSAISYQITPGNVSTQSNLTINFIPFVWRSSQMALKLNFLTYWARNMLNVSSNQVLNSMSFCQPTCIINNMGNFFMIQFNSLTLVGTNISINIFNILSPATLQPADSITITIIETIYSTIVQSGSFFISASSPNNLQILTTSTNSTIGSFVTLSITITSQDLFSSSDSIIIVMNTPVAMASTVTIANILVASNDVSVQQNSIITLSNFNLVTNIPGQFSATITITNISSQPSVKPVSGNKISFYRNGFLYDQSLFSFSANQANISSISLSLTNNQANANTNLTVSIVLTYGVTSTDFLYVNIDQAVTIYTCNVISCSSCTCQITFANPAQGIFSNLLKITSFGSSSSLTSSIVINFSIKNPISSNYILYFVTTDASNYTKQVGSQRFPSITLSVIPSSIFSLIFTSNVVYQPNNFTFGLNFSGYSLLNGWMTIQMDSSITLLNPNNTICLVNGNNGACTLALVNNSIIANVSITAITTFYTIVINNLRNPSSTKHFSFRVSILDVNNFVYYTLLSSVYQVTTPFLVVPQVTSSNCTNSAINTLTITFPFLPFTPTNALLIDDSTASLVRGESILKQIIYPVSFSNNISLAITNSYSLQPTYYQLLVVTNDLLYTIFNFNFTITNCNASNLPIISHTFTGLPQNTGTLSMVISQMIVQNSANLLINGINYLTILFPSEYASNMTISSNAISTSQLGPRYFNLTVGNTQPISLNIWGFTNVISNFFITIHAYSLSQSNSATVYLVSSNTNTIKYNLSSITNCTFPCKICPNSNFSTCLQCYSSATTIFYFIDPVAQSCVTPSSCSSNTFANYISNTCVVCPSQCLTCNSSTSCKSCRTNFYLLNNTCLTDCPSEYYPVNIQQICSPCNSVNNTAHCLICLQLNVCINCLFPYYLSPSTKTCVVSCLSNQIVLNNTCFSCAIYCSTCQGTAENCTSCVTGYFLLLNECVSNCPSPYVPSITTNVCVNCSSICLLCMLNPSTCTSCQFPLKLYNSTCINNCPVGYYTFTASNSTLQCLTCPTQCSACISLTNCSICMSGFFFYNNNCISSCPISTFSITITNNGTLTPVCLPCLSYCLTCSTSTDCSQCQTGYYISPTINGLICVNTCNAGQYLQGNTCKNCSSNCFSCLDSSSCLICSTAYSLQNSSCVSTCTTGYVSMLDSVSLPSSNSTPYVCKTCQSIFQFCSTCIVNACSTCQTGYIINFNKTCVAVCPSGYLNISNFCVSCNPECKACISIQNNCTSCNTGYLLYRNTSSNINQCLANCISGTFAFGEVCLSCSSPCLTCVNSSTSCLSCMSNFYSLMNNLLTCVSSCPSNSYVFNNNCVYCSSSCSLCDSNGCLACSPLFNKNQGTTINGKIYYDCYTTCPSNIPYSINNTCYQCPLNCQICNSTNCLQCSNGLYAYQLYCLAQCPPDMMPNSGVCINIPLNSDSQTNSTVNLTSTTSNIIIPVPFSISCTIIMTTITISKLLHPNTSISLAIFGLISVLAVICNLYYVFKGLTGSFSQEKSIYTIILIVGLLINYINNIIFLFVSKFTLMKDHEFSCWRRGNVELIKEQKIDANQPSHNNLQDHLNSDFNSQLTDNKVPKDFYTYQIVWYSVLIFGLASSQSLYTLVFSKLFDLSIFKATVQSVKNLKILNYIWVVALLAHLICLISGISEAASTYPTKSQYLESVYQSVDIIFLNFICLIFGLLLLRKKKQLWERQKIRSVGDEANSTKKVIFDHESHDIDMNGEVQNQSQVNGKIKNLFGTENGGSVQDLVGAQYKSSTNQQGSALYFEKQQGQNLDNTQEIKLDNNILWMQINPDEMAPQLIEKDDSHLFQESGQAKSPQKNSHKNVLAPDKNLDILDFNKIEPQQQSEDQSSQNNEDEEEQNQQSLSENNNKIIVSQNAQDWEINLGEEGQQNIPEKSQKNKLKRQDSKKSTKNKIVSLTQNMDSTISDGNFDISNANIDGKQRLNQQKYDQIRENSQLKGRDLYEIEQDAQNNERDEQEVSNQKQNFNQKAKSQQKLSKINKIALQKQEQSNKNNEQLQYKVQSNQWQEQESSLNQKQQDQNDEQMINIYQKVKINTQALPLKSDKIDEINKETISNIIEMGQNYQQYISIDNSQEENFGQNNGIVRRESKTQQGTRNRRKKQQTKSRYLDKNQKDNSYQIQSKQTQKNSGLYELFNQYESQGQPRIISAQLDNIFHEKRLSIHDNNDNRETNDFQNVQYSGKKEASPPSQKAKKKSLSKDNKQRYLLNSKYDPIKQQTNELRMSNSAHNFKTKVLISELQKQEFRPMLHENDIENQDDLTQANYRTFNHTHTQNNEMKQSLKKSIYKSINIAKINNRLGNTEQPIHIGLKTVSKDHYSRPNTTMKSERGNRSMSKNEFSSRKVKNFDTNLSQSEKKSVWKSRLVINSFKDNLDGTAKIIQRKSKLAEVKAKLENIYLPNK